MWDKFAEAFPGFVLGFIATCIAGFMAFSNSFAKMEAKFDSMTHQVEALDRKVDNVYTIMLNDKRK